MTLKDKSIALPQEYLSYNYLVLKWLPYWRFRKGYGAAVMFLKLAEHYAIERLMISKTQLPRPRPEGLRRGLLEGTPKKPQCYQRHTL